MGTNGIDSEKFRKQTLDLSLPKQSQFCGIQKPSDFLPPLVPLDSVDQIDVKDVRLRTSRDEKGNVTRHYSVSWRDVVKAEESEEPVGLPGVKKTSSLMKIREGLKTGKIVCDGPCGQTVDTADVAQFGCDHVICDKCRRSQKSTALFDGSPGCCHSDCVKKATDDGEKIQSGRRLDSIASTVSIHSNDGPWEFIQVIIGVLKTWEGQVYRCQVCYEFGSQARVAELAKAVEQFKDAIQAGRTFFSWCKPLTCQDLQPISLLDTNLRFYNLPGYVPIVTGKLYVLVVSDGICLE